MVDKVVPLVAISDRSKDQLINFARQAHALLISQMSLRSAMEEIDRSYMREKNYTREAWEARIRNLQGDASKIQDVTVPVVMPQVESALTYLANVFTTGYPIFGISSDPTNEDAALAMETIIVENSITSGWAGEMIKYFRDGLKYNIHALECDWGQKTVYSIETDVTRPNSAKTKTTLWNGNVLERMDMYNTIFDPRVPPTKIHEDGEFAGYIKLMSRTKLRQYINNMINAPRDSDIQEALRSSSVTASWSSGVPFSYYMPLVNPFPMMNQQSAGMFDWMAWVTDNQSNRQETRSAGMYEVMKLYVRICPVDFGIQAPDSRTPQVWKLIIINGQVLLLAERQTNAHNMIPIIFGQPIEDGLMLQTKSFAQNVGDMQSIASSLANGYIATMRRNVSDRGIFNPMLISSKDMKSNDPAAKIPVKPAGYGRPLTDAYAPVPFRAENSESMLNGVSVVTTWADKVNGQNPAQQGQFVKGNKTLQEYDDVMGHGNGRNQLMAMMDETQVFVPIKEIIKLNILQYQQNRDIYNQAAKKTVSVDVTTLRQKAVQFKMSDGMLPESKIMSVEAWTTAIQAIGASPQLSGGYNLAPMFSYLAMQQGADLTPFEKSPLQMQYEQQMASWQQVAEMAIKAGQPVPAQPQPSSELQQELQVMQQNGGVVPSQNSTTQALISTQGQAANG